MEILKSEIPQKKKEAKRLYVQTDLTAKEIAAKTGISEKTIGVWVKKYGWKIQRENRVYYAMGGQSANLNKGVIMTYLRKHIRKLNPDLYEQVLPLLDSFQLPSELIIYQKPQKQ